MRRTRKWAFVAQEATRLAKLGLSPVDIAAKIGVKRSTVQRWMAAGKLLDTRQNARVERAPRVRKDTKPGEWAAAVRKDYQLDVTDEKLVELADMMLVVSKDPLHAMSTRISAAARYQSLVKQLNLVTRTPEVEKPEPVEERAPQRAVRTLPRRPAGDPRKVLQVVK